MRNGNASVGERGGGTLPEQDAPLSLARAAREAPVLVVAWSAEPGHVGEALVPVPGRRFVFGRGLATGDDPEPRLFLVRQRPGENAVAEPLTTPRISRVQLTIVSDGDRLTVESPGMLPLTLRGVRVERCVVSPGDVLHLGRQLVLVCVRRPSLFAGAPAERHPFGTVDADGLVGESAAAWEIRERIAYLAARSEHALILGPSGSGKEVVAQAIHARGRREARPLLSRNASTLPEGIVDAELFGNARGYPHAGIPERPGLIGQANGTTLFLDEIGDLPVGVQTHLLRVLDAGEYTRLGEATPRHSDFRLIAATNRPLSALRSDVLARFQLRLELPTIAARKEDLPLLVEHEIRRIATYDPIARRYLDEEGRPRLDLAWVVSLLARRFETNVRELQTLLWDALGRSPTDVLGEGLEAPSEAPAHADERGDAGDPAEATGQERVENERERVERVLAEHNGSLEDAWRALGLANRYALRRLLKKHNIAVVKRHSQSGD